MNDAEVLIVGAGPAGAALASFLRRAGREALLVDRARWPREKTCGDGLSPRALAMLSRLGVLDRVLSRACVIRRAVIVAPGGGRVVADIPRAGETPVPMAVFRRIELDDVLLREALARGAGLRDGCRVTGFLEENGRVVGVQAASPSGPVQIRAQVVAVACGASPTLLERAGVLVGKPLIGMAARAYYEDVPALSDEVELRFDAATLPGYSWVFPVGPTTANVGVGCFPRGAAGRPPIRSMFEQAVTSSALGGRLAGARQVGDARGLPLHVGFRSVRLSRPGLVLVGEAAGLVNPLTGEGVEAALESAETAAEILAAELAAGGPPERLAERYAAALRQRFLRTHKGIMWVRELYFRRWMLDRLVAAAARRPDLRELLVEVALGLADPAKALRPSTVMPVLAG